jgi:hypothetical protein
VDKLNKGSGVMAHTCNPSYTGGRDKRLAGPYKSTRPYLKNKIKQKGL